MNSLITIGNYKNTAYSFVNGTRVVTITGLDNTIDISKVKLFSNQTQNKAYGVKTLWSGNTASQSVPATTLTVGTATSGGAVTAGTHQYKVTYVYSTGEESLASAASSVITVVASNFTVPLTNIPIGTATVVARNIYRTAAAGSTWYYLAQLADNTTTTYSDIIADATLIAGAVEPATSGAFDITLTSSYAVLATGDILNIEIEINNSVDDDDLGVTKIVSLDAALLPPADSEVATVTDTNLAVGLYFYELPQGNWVNFIAQLKATCTTKPSTIKIFATLDPAAAVPATNGTASVDWTDITFFTYGVNQLTVPITGTLVTPIANWATDNMGKPMMFDRFMVQYQPLHTVNFININVRKH